MPSPLHGVRVLDLTRVLSGPHCTRMLCDMGAEVIKIEPPTGDLTRFSSPRRNGLSSYFVQQNVGKSNLSIDLAQPEGAEILLSLAEQADVLVENYRPGVMARLGLGADVVRARNPRLIYASLSGYGQTGPWVHRRAFAPVVEAEAGIIASQGNARAAAGRDGSYSKDPHSHADVYTGMETASAILAALYQREHTGVGQSIDISMAETMLYVNEHIHDAMWTDQVDADAVRSFRPGDYAVLEIATGEHFIVSGHPAEKGTFEFFLNALGRPELATDERFTTVGRRVANLDELNQILRDFAIAVPSAEEFEQIFADAGFASGLVRQPGELADTDWAIERDATVWVDDRAGGTIRVPNVPWHFSGSPDVQVSGIPKYRGEDNRQILSDLLGYDDARLDALHSSGVLSDRLPRPSS